MAISKQSGIFRKSGDTLDITIAADGTAIPCGAIKVVNGFNCLALWDIEAGTSGTMKILQRGEVVEVTVDDVLGETNAGIALYLDENGVITKSATHTEGAGTAPNTLLGYTRTAVAATAKTFELLCA